MKGEVYIHQDDPTVSHLKVPWYETQRTDDPVLSAAQIEYAHIQTATAELKAGIPQDELARIALITDLQKRLGEVKSRANIRSLEIDISYANGDVPWKIKESQS